MLEAAFGQRKLIAMLCPRRSRKAKKGTFLGAFLAFRAFHAWAPSFEAEIGLAITQQSLDSSRFGIHLRAQVNTCLSQSQKHQ